MHAPPDGYTLLYIVASNYINATLKANLPYNLALAVTAARRSEALPELPTVANFVPGYEASTVGGIGAPKRMPTAIVNKLNTEINAVLADPNLRSRYAALGSEPDSMSPSEFGKVIVAETEKWDSVIKFAGVKPE